VSSEIDLDHLAKLLGNEKISYADKSQEYLKDELAFNLEQIKSLDSIDDNNLEKKEAVKIAMDDINEINRYLKKVK